MAERREMGRDAADPKMHDRGTRSETTTVRGETSERQPGHIERHESRSSAGNEAQVAGILHGSGDESGKDSASSGRWSDESDATSHMNANAHRGSEEQTHGQPEKKSSASERSSGKKRRGAA